jgi:hypothetical protein
MELRIEVNERKVLPLLVRVGFLPSGMARTELYRRCDVQELLKSNFFNLWLFPVPNFMSILAGRAVGQSFDG